MTRLARRRSREAKYEIYDVVTPHELDEWLIKQARMDKLRDAGYCNQMQTLEQGVTTYFRDYLGGPMPVSR